MRPLSETYSSDGPREDDAWVAVREPLRHFLRDKVLAHLLSNVTHYGSGYSEETFHAIALGATMKQVQLALGDPLNRAVYRGGEIWYYSEQGDPLQDYLVRGLVFDRSGNVAEKLTDFYID